MKKGKLALFLGMLCGDGCLTVRHRKRGGLSCSIDFFNTKEEIVNKFNNLFLELFNIKGNIHIRRKENRKPIYEFRSYNRLVFDKLVKIGFPKGKKKYSLSIPFIIKNGSEKEKINFFKGFLITDGCVRKNKTIIFHSGSFKFLKEISLLLKSLFGIDKSIKEYAQGKYYSYQLNLNKPESLLILSNMPPSHNGIATALSCNILYN